MAVTSVGGESPIRMDVPWSELPEASRGWAAGASAALERAGAGAPAARAGAVGAGPAYLAMPAQTGYAPRAEAFAPAERGYAAAPAAANATAAVRASQPSSKATAPKSSSKTSSAKPSTSKTSSSRSASTKTSSAKTPTSTELAFLDDPNVSVEDKLFRFMTLMQKKADAELVDAMKRYEEKKAASPASGATSTSSSGAKTGTATGSSPPPAKKDSGGGGGGGGGLFGMIGDALGGIARSVVSGAESLAKDLGGPLLAAGATAVGLPFLAPVALQIGGTLAKSAVSGLASAVGLDELGKSSGSSSARAASTASASASTARAASAAKATAATKTTSTSATKPPAADDGVFDEKLEMLGLQRLVEKQQTMFAALSNVLKAQHEGQMVAVNNIR